VSLEWDRDRGTYTYTSTQLFTRGADSTRRTRIDLFEVDDQGRDKRTGAYPQSLALWRGRRAGAGDDCVDTVEELGGHHGTLCFGSGGEGTASGQPFRATWDEVGLRSLELGTSRFLRVPPGTVPAAPPDLFARGFPILGRRGKLALAPSLEESKRARGANPRPAPSEKAARALSNEVADSFVEQKESAADFRDDPQATAGSCLGHALRYRERALRRGFDASIVEGLVVLPGESVARPHAWVRVRLPGGRALELDPTLGVEVQPATHLALVDPGEAWLGLLSGARSVVRR
jgi:hypothetical protein